MIDRFVDPYYLLLLLLLPPLVWWYVTRGERTLGAVRYSAVDRLVRADRRRTGRWRHAPFGLRLLALALLLVAFRPPADRGDDRERRHRRDRHRAGAGPVELDAGRGPGAEPHRGGPPGGGRLRARAAERSHRTGRLCRRGVHAGAAHPRPPRGDHVDRGSGGGRHRGRDRYRDGAGHRGQAARRFERRVEGDRAAHRRPEQPRRHRSGDRGPYGAGARRADLRRRRRNARRCPRPGRRSAVRPPPCLDAGRHRRRWHWRRWRR